MGKAAEMKDAWRRLASASTRWDRQLLIGIAVAAFLLLLALLF
jgi:hypothetical protein